MNGKIYIGKHSTENLDDGYLGSGVLLHKAIQKYGRESFNREIIEYLESSEDALLRESEIVDIDFVNRDDTYNLRCGGDGNTKGHTVVKDEQGVVFQVSINDPRYLNGELVGIANGFVTVKDVDGNTSRVSVNDPRYLSGELVHHTKDTISVKDCDGNIFRVHINDPRYLNGELVGITKNNKASDDTKRKMSETRKGRKLTEEHRNNIRTSLIGKPGNTKGRIWINNKKERKLIDKQDINYWTSIGWVRGFKYE